MLPLKPTLEDHRAKKNIEQKFVNQNIIFIVDEASMHKTIQRRQLSL